MTTSALSRSLRRLHRDQRGVTAVIVVLTLPVLFAFGALVINSGLWFTIKRQNQSAADAAAISAAYEVMAGNTDVTNNLIPAATQAAGPTQNGYVGSALTACTTGGTCCLESPPLSKVCYPYNDSLLDTGFGAGKYQAVAVTLVQSQDSLFAFAPLNSATIATKAVGVVLAREPSCILALGTGNITDVDVVGSASVCLGPLTGTTCGTPTCSISANSTSSSSIHLQGSAKVTADTLITPGGNVGFTGGAFTLTLNSPPVTFGPPVVDPYASTLTHTFLTTGPPAMPTAGACNSSTSGTVTTYSPGDCVISGGLTVDGGTVNTVNLSANTQIGGDLSIKNAAVHLAPGTYWIAGGNLNLQSGTGATLDCPSCTPGGAGVTIILTTALPSGSAVGAVTLASNSTMTLNAPKTGTFAGMAIIQDPNGLPTANSSFSANSNVTLNGLVYFPNSDLTFRGTPAAGSATCLVLVVRTLTLVGNPGFNSTGCSNAGLSTLPTPQMVVLGG